MNDSGNWQLAAIDATLDTDPTDGDRWRKVNSNNDLITQLLSDLQRRVLALEGEVAKLRTSESVGDDDTDPA